jgi:hypothetical protein
MESLLDKIFLGIIALLAIIAGVMCLVYAYTSPKE